MGVPEGPYANTAEPGEPGAKVEQVARLLSKQRNAPYGWLALLTILALSPYKKVRRPIE